MSASTAAAPPDDVVHGSGSPNDRADICSECRQLGFLVRLALYRLRTRPVQQVELLLITPDPHVQQGLEDAPFASKRRVYGVDCYAGAGRDGLDRAGRVAVGEHWGVPDQLGMMMQLGHITPPARPAPVTA